MKKVIDGGKIEETVGVKDGAQVGKELKPESEFRKDQNQAGKENGSEIGNNSETNPKEDSGRDQQSMDLMVVDLANKRWIQGSETRKKGLA